MRIGTMGGAVVGLMLFVGAPTRVEADPKLQKLVVAIEGFCPVSYQTVGEPRPGLPNFASQHNGYTYFMASAKNKELFDKDPERYVPAIGGLCQVGLGGPYGNRFAGDPRVFSVINKKLYLISSVRAKRSFDKDPGHYISRAKALYDEPAIQGYCPIAYLNGGKPVKGKAEFRREFRGRIYHLASAEAVKIYEKKGAAAMPEFGGACAEGVSRGLVFPGDPAVFGIFLGKGYLFYDEGAKTKFMSKATTLVDEAEARWPAIRVKKGPTGRP